MSGLESLAHTWYGIAGAAGLSTGGTVAFVKKFASSILANPSGGDLVARLDKRVETLESELNTEREGRADDNTRWQKRFDDNNDRWQEKLDDSEDRWQRRAEEMSAEMSRLREDLAVTRIKKGIN